MALLLFQAKGEHSRLAPQALCPFVPYRQEYMIRIKAVIVFPSSAEFQKGEVADKIWVCTRSQVVGSPNLDELLWSL